MADTRRALDDFLNSSTGLLKDNTAGDISAQDLRDLVLTTFGAMAQDTTHVAGADAEAKAKTLVVGSITPIDLSGATGGALNGNVVITLPSTPTAGDMCGLFILAQATVTSATFPVAPAFCAEIANATVINNTAVTALTTGGSKWSLWLESEMLVFRYVDATVGWQVVHNGKASHKGFQYLANDVATFHGSSAWKDVPCDTIDTAIENAGLTSKSITTGDPASATCVFKIKRSGVYLFTGNTFGEAIANACALVARVSDGTIGSRCQVSLNFSGAGKNMGANASGVLALSGGASAGVECYCDDATRRTASRAQGTPTERYNWQSCTELL